MNDEKKPITDEFGRSDPDTVERELRRREREEKRQKKSGRGSGSRGGGSRGGRSRGRRDPDTAAVPEPIAERPAVTSTSRKGRGRRAQQRQTAQQSPAAQRSSARQASTPPPTERRPRPALTAGGYGRRRFAAMAMILGGILLLWFLIAFFQPFAGDGLGEGSVQVEISEGADAGEIADILAENDVIDNATLFTWRLRLAGKSDEIEADTYSMAEGMSYGAAIDRLSGSTEGLETVTIPEGLSRPEVAELTADAGIPGDYESATQSVKGFNPSKYGAEKPPSLEGFLFPATYELADAGNAEQLVGLQLDAFQQQIEGVDLSYAKKKNLNVYDVLKIASMIEREVMVPNERPLVAAVIYNRLKNDMPLGIDATTRFETGNFDQPLTAEVLEKDSPFNTRTRAGLPPTPIGNPGLDAIEAAAQPAKVPFLFYVVKPNTCGEHTFVKTEAEFEKAVAEYNDAREEAGGNAPTDC